MPLYINIYINIRVQMYVYIIYICVENKIITWEYGLVPREKF